MELRVIKGLLASFAIHIFLVILAAYFPKIHNSPSRVSQVEIQIIDREKNKPQSQIVREAPLPERLKVESSEDTQVFLSKERQRVRKQTRAELNGLTANRSESALSQSRKPPAFKNLLKLSKREGTPIKAPERDQQQSQNNALLNMPRGLSTTGEVLPQEMQVGSFTALNTDRYLYYSFFARVEEIIRYPWENTVRWVLETTPRAAFQNNVAATWITSVDILLWPNGEFHTALVLKESGLRGFDRAATQSFAQAKVFPNPPEELVEEDGFIHLRYRFNVRVDPRVVGRQ